MMVPMSSQPPSQNASQTASQIQSQLRDAIEDMTNRLGTLLPPGATQLKTDFENNARTVLQGTLEKMDLVTREEFEIQQRVLQKTRSKLEDLERRLEVHLAELDSNNKAPPS